MSIKTKISAGRTRFAKYAQGGPRWIRRLYLGLASEPFEREKAAVNEGISSFLSKNGEPSELFELRRAIHMLEKGLTMKPRRPVFATGYIQRTIELYVATVGTTGAAELDEVGWMTHVLDDYFEATLMSENRLIDSARSLYNEHRVIPAAATSGPHPAGHKPSENHFDSVRSLAHGRRSVRWYRSEAVDRRIVDAAVDVAMESPTACNRQPYRFLVFDQPSDVEKVAAVPMGTAGYAHQLSGVIVVVGDLSAFFDERDRHLIYIDSSLASMALIFGLEAQGVSTCCINWPDIPQKDIRMRELIGLKKYERVIMLIAYGYGDEDGLVPFSQKKPLSMAREFRSGL